jgi:hypothetical protein
MDTMLPEQRLQVLWVLDFQQGVVTVPSHQQSECRTPHSTWT